MNKILRSKHYVTFRYSLYFLLKKNFPQLSEGLLMAIATDGSLLYLSIKDMSLVSFSKELLESIKVNNLLFREALPEDLLSTIGMNITSLYTSAFEVFEEDEDDD